MIFVKIEKNRYIDSLETLSETAFMNEQPGVRTAFVGMATDTFKEVTAEIGLSSPEISACSEADYVIVADCESEDAFHQAVETMKAESAPSEDLEVQEISIINQISQLEIALLNESVLASQ